MNDYEYIQKLERKINLLEKQLIEKDREYEILDNVYLAQRKQYEFQLYELKNNIINDNFTKCTFMC